MNLTAIKNEKVVLVDLFPSKTSKHIQLAVKSCPYCKQRHNHGVGEGWRLSDCYDRKTGENIPSASYYIKIDWSVPAHAKLRDRYESLLQSN